MEGGGGRVEGEDGEGRGEGEGERGGDQQDTGEAGTSGTGEIRCGCDCAHNIMYIQYM